MSIFVKAGLWIEKQVGHKGELNLTRFVTDLISANPSSPAVIETDGVFNNNVVFTTEQVGIPQQGATGVVSVSSVEARSYNINTLTFSNPNDITFIKFNDSVVNFLNIDFNSTGGFAIICNNLTYVANFLQTSGNVSSISLPILEKANSLNLYINTSTSISLPSLLTVSSFEIGGDLLTSINMPVLTSILSSANIGTAPSLTSLTFPSLTYLSNFNIQNLPVLTSVAFPLLNGDILINSGLTVVNCPLLTSINLPSLTSFDALNFNNNASLTSINLDTLVNINILTVQNCPLTSISLPALTTIGSLDLSDDALTEEAVDYILAKLVSIPTFTGVSCSVNLTGLTNSAPSAAGLLNVAILEARGCTVTTN
jgi:hypothetical protein